MFLSLAAFAAPVFAEDDHTNPVDDPVKFIGEAVENTVSIAVGAVGGTVQSLGELGGKAVKGDGDDEDESEEE